jgi:tRNA-splicing ligase RtcB
VSADTEYLSPTGWKRIDQYDGGKVMQYDPETGSGTFVAPERYIVRDEKEFLHFRTKYGINQMLSADHNVLAYRITGRDSRREMTTLSAARLADIHESLLKGAKYEFETSFHAQTDTKVWFTDDEIRLQVAFLTHGLIRKRSADSNERCRIATRKERKMERLRMLLHDTGTEYTEGVPDRFGTVSFYFHPPVRTKHFALFWAASYDQLKVIAEECLVWSGSEKEQVFYSSDPDSADFIHYAFAATGWRSVLRVDPPRTRDAGAGARPDYRVFRYRRTKVGLSGIPRSPIEVVKSSDGKSYCFAVEKGFWVMRRGGNVAMTGSCSA